MLVYLYVVDMSSKMRYLFIAKEETNYPITFYNGNCC